MDNRWDALDDLIAAMLMTSQNAWPHAPWFGLFELATAPNTDEREIVPAINRALEELGVTWAEVSREDSRVSDVEQSGSRTGDRYFHLAFTATDGSPSHTITRTQTVDGRAS